MRTKGERHQRDKKNAFLGKVRLGTSVLQMALNASTTHQFQHAVVAITALQIRHAVIASTILHVQQDVVVALAVPATSDETAVFQDRLLRRAPQ